MSAGQQEPLFLTYGNFQRIGKKTIILPSVLASPRVSSWQGGFNALVRKL